VARRHADRGIRRHRLRPVLLHRAHAHAGPVPAALDAPHSASIHAGRTDRRVLLAVPVPEHVLPGEHVNVWRRSAARDRALLPAQLRAHVAGHLDVARYIDVNVARYFHFDVAGHLDVNVAGYIDKHDSIVRLVFVDARLRVSQHALIPVRVAACLRLVPSATASRYLT